MKHLSVLIKPASSKCNMACSYCFYEDVALHRYEKDYGMMTYETMEKIIDQTLKFNDQGTITFSFQGGEPTLRGLPFFKHFVFYALAHKTDKQHINYTIQTNGTLLNDPWLDFFYENQFLVGISIDGTAKHHNRYRYFRNHQKSFDDVFKGYRALKTKGIDVNVLTVVNNDLAEDIESVYQFYQAEQITHLQFLPELSDIDHMFETTALTEEKYLIFIKKLFDMWYEDIRNQIPRSIKYFDQILLMYLGYEPESCEMKGHCSIQNVIEADGSVYPCDFYVTDSYKLGDISLGFEHLVKTKKAQDFVSESIVKHKDCYTCEWYHLCRTGCKRRRDESHKELYCEANQAFFSYTDERFKALAKDIKNGLVIK